MEKTKAKAKDIAIEIDNVSKIFDTFKASKNINLTINRGEVFGLIGQNGAGKSTLINMLITILKSTGGNIRINDKNIDIFPFETRKDIGVVFQQSTLDDNETIYRNLWFHGKLFKLDSNTIKKRISELLAIVSLSDSKDKKVKALSGGQKRKVELIRAILHDPQILFLDEPTTGLDPQAREDIWKYILRIQKTTNLTILLSTHYMEELNYCSRLGLIHDGELVETHSLDNFKYNHLPTTIKLFTKQRDAIKKELANSKDNIKVIKSTQNYVEIKIPPKINPNHILSNLVIKKKLGIESFKINKPNLDEIFISVTKEQNYSNKEKDIVSALAKEKPQHREKKYSVFRESKYKNVNRFNTEAMVQIYNQYLDLKYTDKKNTKEERKELRKQYKLEKAKRPKPYKKNAEYEEKKILRKQEIAARKAIEAEKRDEIEREKTEVNYQSNTKYYSRLVEGNRFGTIYWRELRRLFINKSTLGSIVVTPFLLWIMTALFTTFAGITFVEAMTYSLPISISLIVVTAGIYYGTTVLPDLHSGFMKEMLISPIRRWEIAAGNTFAAATSLLVPALLMFLVGLGLPIDYNFVAIFPFIPAFFLSALVFVGFSFWLSLKIKNAKTLLTVFQIIAIPLVVIGLNTISIETYVPWFTVLWLINPISYIQALIYPILNTESIEFVTEYDTILQLSERTNVGDDFISYGAWAGLTVMLSSAVVIFALLLRTIKNLDGSKKISNV